MKINNRLIKSVSKLALLFLFLSCGVAKTKESLDSNDVATEAFNNSSHMRNASFSQKKEINQNVEEAKELSGASYDASSDAFYEKERKLIKNGYIVFESQDIKESYALIKNMLTTKKGYISSENEYSTPKTQEMSIQIRVPKEEFDAFFEAIEKVAHYVKNKSIDIQDVTEEFIDINARLKVKKEAEETYLRLLGSAKSVRDVLDIQDQLQGIRGEIESIEGRLKYLENAVSFSTLDIHIYQYVAKSEGPTSQSFFTRIFSSLKSGVRIFSEVIIGVLNAWVFIVLGAIILIVINVVIKKRKKK